MRPLADPPTSDCVGKPEGVFQHRLAGPVYFVITSPSCRQLSPHGLGSGGGPLAGSDSQGPQLRQTFLRCSPNCPGLYRNVVRGSSGVQAEKEDMGEGPRQVAFCWAPAALLCARTLAKSHLCAGKALGDDGPLSSEQQLCLAGRGSEPDCSAV